MKKIGWQKYEDYIEKQLSSPILTNMIQNIAASHLTNTEEEMDDEEDYEEDEEDNSTKKPFSLMTPLMPLTNQLMDDIAMLSSFDCWIGHTNFDITPSIKNTLDKIPGIEILKIFSRYRFFVGIGRMFDFKDVRKNIEDALIEGE